MSNIEIQNPDTPLESKRDSKAGWLGVGIIVVSLAIIILICWWEWSVQKKLIDVRGKPISNLYQESEINYVSIIVSKLLMVFVVSTASLSFCVLI